MDVLCRLQLGETGIPSSCGKREYGNGGRERGSRRRRADEIVGGAERERKDKRRRQRERGRRGVGSRPFPYPLACGNIQSVEEGGGERGKENLKNSSITRSAQILDKYSHRIGFEMSTDPICQSRERTPQRASTAEMQDSRHNDLGRVLPGLHIASLTPHRHARTPSLPPRPRQHQPHLLFQQRSEGRHVREVLRHICVEHHLDHHPPHLRKLQIRQIL